MSRRRAASLIRRPRRGFTLVELLFAIVILLFGVVVALRIFPPGFEVFSENQRFAAAQAQTDGLANALAADPDGMPDAIMPVNYDAMSVDISAMSLRDLTAVDYSYDSADRSATWRERKTSPGKPYAASRAMF